MVVVNATEGEPGSDKDRMLLRRSPYLVLGGALVAARALRAMEILIGVTGDGTWPARSRALRRRAGSQAAGARGQQVPERFVSGEGSALVNAMNGKTRLPPGRKVRASDTGVDDLPDLPVQRRDVRAARRARACSARSDYASIGTSRGAGHGPADGGRGGEPARRGRGAGGAAARARFSTCAAPTPGDGVLVGGYHGMWLPTEAAYDVPVSRAGLTAAGGSLGAGIVLPLG